MRKELLTPASLQGKTATWLSIYYIQGRTQSWGHQELLNNSQNSTTRSTFIPIERRTPGIPFSVKNMKTIKVRGSNVTSRTTSRQSSTSTLDSIFLGRESVSTDAQINTNDFSSPAMRRHYVMNRSLRTYGTKNISKLYDELLRDS